MDRARSTFSSAATPVDLVFTDLIMPGGLSGREVAIRAREIKPGIKVLLTSGYAEELVRGDDLQRDSSKCCASPTSRRTSWPPCATSSATVQPEVQQGPALC